MNSKKIFISTLFLLSSCNSKDSNPKDYWSLSEPKIITWEATSNSEIIPPKIKNFTNFRSSDIETTLGYDSHILINNISSDINFTISTTCEELNISNATNQTLQDQNTPSVIFKKTSTLEKSNKIYFYNFIPEELILDPEYRSLSPDYKCDFEVTALNKINSVHKFKIENIKINTFNVNFVSINSLEKTHETSDSESSSIIKTISVNREIRNIELPSLFYNGEPINYSMSLNKTGYVIKNPSYIQCSGQNNKFDLLTHGNETRQIDDIFKIAAADSSTTFLKKCRILALINKETKPEDKILYTEELENSNQRLVWSDYFNVIFQSPKIEVKTQIIELTSNTYPFNHGLHIDSKTHVFNLVFTNKSKKRTKLHFPETQNIKTLITPLILISQRPNFKKNDIVDIPSTFRIYEMNDSFFSSLHLALNNESFSDFTLEPEESKTVQIFVSKNFNCQLPKRSDFYEYPYSEIGFKIQAIDLDLDEYKIQADFQNQGQLDWFPEGINFDQLLQQSKNTIYRGTPQEKEINTNHLQVIEDRKFIIDTVVLRNMIDADISNYSENFIEQTQHYIFGSPNRPVNIYNNIYEADYSGLYCEKLY